YRSNIEIVSTAGMTPVVTDIHELSTVDPSPSNTEHFYAVTAVDAVGNESSPSDSVYLGFDLLPVSSLTVEQLNQDYPVVNWTHNGDNVIGYNLYIGEGAGRVLVPGSPMAGLAYTDIGYDNSERRYTVAAVDTFGNVSIERSVTLSPLETRVINPPAIKRGLFTAMEFEVSNLSSVPVGGAVLQLQLGTSVYQTESFNLAPEESHTESLVVAGYLDLPSIAPLTTSVSVIQPGGETTRTVRTGNIEVIDGALVAGLLTNNFTRGVSGTVRFTLENTGDQEIGIVTARNFGAIGSDEVKLRLEDTDGNLLATQTVKQVFGENLITLSNGTTLARIAPGAIFTSKPVQIPVPLASPDEVFVKLVVDKVHHAFATPNAIQLPGPTTRQMVRLVDVAYGCSVTGIAPLYSQGGEPIVLTGSTVSTADGSPLPLVPLRLVIRANGFERKYDLYADTAGNYSYTFNPLPWESGIYSVSCIHPDLNDRHESGQFTIGKVFVLPNRVQLFIERNTEEIIPLQIHSAAGTTEKSISLAFDASDQPDGELPPGIQLVLSDPLTLPSGGTGQMSVRVQAGSAAEAGGTFVVAVRDDTSGGQKLAFITVDFNVYEPGTARPSLVTSKSYIETGVTYGNRVSETLFIENRGLTEARDIQIALTNPDGSPAPNWIYLASPASIDKLDVGESQLLEIVAAPTSSVAEALHEFRLRFSAANHKTFQQSIFVTVTTSEIGDVQLHVSDIYTQTKNDADELIEGVENAKIRIQNQNVLTIDRTLTTDVWGNAVSTNLPAGLYKYRATAADHQDRIGFFWIRPGISVSQEVFLDYNLVTVEWSVREITIQDRYEIVLKAIYKVDIPAPVVVTEPPGVTLPPMEPGDVYHGQFDLVNYGLIRADNLAMQLPASNNYFAIDFLSNIPDS
ncbi:MAG: hypothetical protein KDI27_12850, partial [Gammaproteobacteria bacterium]|nr:hypothetical protein [Gammaproteobacteria bacterium]